MQNKPDFSFLIPAFNEAESLEILYNEIRQVVAQLNKTFEIIFLDDGSTDNSWEIIKRLADTNPQVRGISFRRNFGKSAALSEGFKIAQAPIIFNLDADLQDDPAMIPRFLDKLNEGYDLVIGWKQNRLDPKLTKNLPSKLFNATISRVSGAKLHDHNCGFKAMRSEVASVMNIYGELHRFIPAIAHWNGFKVAEVPVIHRARKFGKTKFGMERFINGFLDLMTVWFLQRRAFSPLHLFGRIALFFGGIGTLILIYFLVLWMMGQGLHVRPVMLLGGGLILIAIQILVFGFLGEMISAQNKDRDYPIVERVG
jgi:glycosyltransferase involved in cell wall biosynthesis